MKSLEAFKVVATNIYNPYVRAFKENGGKVIGYHCSFLPVAEIYHAAGMLGVRLRANEATATTIGDTYFGHVICSFPKCMLHLAGEGKYKFMDGLVTSTGCDAMRRLYDCWVKASEDYEGILPDFFYFFGVPHKTLDFSKKWFADEIRNHIEELEKSFNVTITPEKLRASIKRFNEARNLLRQLDEIRRRPKVPISGADATAVLIAASGMPVDEFISSLKELIADLEKQKKGLPGKRVMMTGSVNDDLNFIRTIEEEGTVVVADTLCFGSRFFENMVSEEDGVDPVDALSAAYLDELKCPRMIGEFKSRKAWMLEKIKKAGVQGVILQNIRFCDLHGSENGVLERDFEAMGIPCLVLEREYGPLVDSGRVKMRVEAFLQRIH